MKKKKNVIFKWLRYTDLIPYLPMTNELTFFIEMHIVTGHIWTIQVIFKCLPWSICFTDYAFWGEINFLFYKVLIVKKQNSIITFFGQHIWEFFT